MGHGRGLRSADFWSLISARFNAAMPGVVLYAMTGYNKPQ